MKKNYVFDLFRFQISPISTHQMDLFSESISADELKARKNKYFEEVLLSDTIGFHNLHGNILQHRKDYNEGDLIVFRLGKVKRIYLPNEEYQEEAIEYYPNVLIVINNNPQIQRIAISRDERAFPDSFNVAEVFNRAINTFLYKYHLEFAIAPELDQKEFWSLLHQYQNRITRIQFNLIKPNLSEISRTFKDDIRELGDTTNSMHTKIELNAPQKSVLENISEENPRIKALADYSIQGGAQNVQLKVQGISKQIQTKKTVKKVEISIMELNGNATDVIEVYRKIVE